MLCLLSPQPSLQPSPAPVQTQDQAERQYKIPMVEVCSRSLVTLLHRGLILHQPDHADDVEHLLPVTDPDLRQWAGPVATVVL